MINFTGNMGFIRYKHGNEDVYINTNNIGTIESHVPGVRKHISEIKFKTPERNVNIIYSDKVPANVLAEDILEVHNKGGILNLTKTCRDY